MELRHPLPPPHNRPLFTFLLAKAIIIARAIVTIIIASAITSLNFRSIFMTLIFGLILPHHLQVCEHLGEWKEF